MSASTEKIGALYQRMTLREKLLVLLITLVLLLLWANHWGNRMSDWNAQRNATDKRLDYQNGVLERSDSISAQLATALERVDPSKTYAAAQLSGRVDSLIRKATLSTQADIDPVRTRKGEIFNDHNLRVRLSRISIAQFIALNNLFSQDTPYINIQSVRIQKNRRNPEQLDVRYEINSFDLKDQNL